jgi:putative DNA primase/helicase
VGWPDPKDLVESLPTVPSFPLKLLPKEIANYVKDVSERFSCPPDFPAIAAVVAIGAAIGARVFCRPYANGTWMVPAGAWGMVVSPPSATKSPPLSEMLRPLYKMDQLAADQYQVDLQQYDILKQIHDNAIKASIKQGQAPVGLLPPMEPVMTRYVVNDSTYEMLVAIAAANPHGFLIWRDELVGWFHSLNKENQKEARGLYLTGWTGTEGYATDRIGRGHVRADRVNLSLLGTIQPNVLRGIVYDAVAGGAGDDGLVARFQLAVYPNPAARYVKVDRAPNRLAMHHYDALIKRLVTLDPSAIGASFTSDGTPYLPFDSDAQAIFDDWRQALEDRIRDINTEEHPAMLAHLGKYRSLFPKLALVLHLAAGGVGPIGRDPALRAKVWTEYLEAHARRIYHTATNRAMQSAVALANKIKANKLSDGFTKSDVLVKEWAGLRSADEVATALTVLKDGSWLTVHEDRSTGGRPAERHYINPKVKRAA